MPGIAGFISTALERPGSADLGTMVRTMLHEPDYATGCVVVEQLGVSAGWVCHGNSYSDCLPIWNASRDVCLLFVGEEFSAVTGRDPRDSEPHVDPELAAGLVHRYEREGEAFFARLNGLFCGLLIDLRRKEVVLFNDRYGLGRLYCHQGAGVFYFASEAKALLKVLPELRELDMHGLGEYFACGTTLRNRTLFSGISLLPAGSNWRFDGARPPRETTYFNRGAWESRPSLPEADYYEKLNGAFRRVLPKYLDSEGTMAMSLTGGLDSRMIMAWANGDMGRLQCYSHRGMFNECVDARLARRVAEACGCPHRVIRVGEEFVRDFPGLATRTIHLTDGTMDVTGAAGLYANRVAREIARVRMTGNYGGEILRGVVMLRPSKLRNSYFDPDFGSLIARGGETLAEESRVPRTSFVAFKQTPWHHYPRFALESSQWTIRSPYLDNELVSLAYQAPKDVRANQRLAERLISDGNPSLAAFPTDRGPLGRHGVLGRVREVYQELTFKADYAYDYGMPQWVVNADRIMNRLHLERLFLGRHKYYHFRFWYRNQLAPFVRDILLDPRALQRPYLDRKRVIDMVTAHVNGRGNYTVEITSLLTSELLQRQLIESIA